MRKSFHLYSPELLAELTPTKDGLLLPVEPVSAGWKVFPWSVNRLPGEAMVFYPLEQ